jgi:hypothetical protein
LDVLISPKEAETIVSFLGYGNRNAAVVFIGLEEGLGNMTDGDAAENLRARGRFERVMDLHEAHLQLRENGRPIDIALKAPPTQVWKYAAKIMLAREKHESWRDRRAVDWYIKSRLGRKDGETFLTELSPIPTGRNSDKRWMTAFSERLADMQTGLEQRTTELRGLLMSNPRSLIICYGNRPSEFEALLGIRWRQISEKVRASPDSKYLLLPFFGNGHMSHAVIEALLEDRLLG